MAQTNQPEHDLILQANEACSRALLSCEAPSHDTDEVKAHPLALRVGMAKLDSDAARRGWNDCMAFLHAYHDQQVHQQLSPPDTLKAQLFDVMEYERCLSVGADQYRGAATNILLLKSAASSVSKPNDAMAQLREQMAVLIRSALNNQPMPALVDVQHPAMLRLAETLVQVSDALHANKNNQQAFAKLVQSILALLELEYDLNGNPAPAAGDRDGNPEESGEGAKLEGSAEQTEGQQSESLTEESEEPPSMVMSTESEGPDEMDALHAIDDAASVSSTSEAFAQGVQAAQEYKAYTTQHDEIVNAADLTLVNTLAEYRQQLDVFIGKHGAVVNRLSARLRQLLLAQQRSSWSFDQEEGVLDTSRLTRLVTAASHPLSFKVEQDSLFKDTAVTLLIDNSKSMVGKPIATAAACADILAQTLERCGVSVEILGFTTTELHGSDYLESWQSDGAVDAPGRMNGLRHIIYKPASVPYRKASLGIGVMLDKELLKQNIDGEALQWAYKRISKRPQVRKIMMVISDGAPLDASTLTANSQDYLVKHLRKTIAKVESDKNVELCAIGINHDVSHYYQNAVSIHDTRDLGKALLEQLSKLFKR